MTNRTAYQTVLEGKGAREVEYKILRFLNENNELRFMVVINELSEVSFTDLNEALSFVGQPRISFYEGMDSYNEKAIESLKEHNSWLESLV